MRKIILTAVVVAAGIFNSNAQVTNNILLHYPFDGNANDISGNGIDGIENGGVSLTTDRFGNANSAYEFDGIDDYIAIPHNTLYKTNLPKTVSLWVYADDSSAINQIFKTDNDSVRYYGYNLNSSSGNFSASVMNGAGAGSQFRRTFASNMGFNSNSWHHVVVVYNSVTNIDMYIDGQLSAGNYSGTGSTLNYSTEDGSIGFAYNQFGNSHYYFKGKIDDLMIIDTVLNQNDVSNLFVEQAGCAGNYMNFDGSDDRVEVDSVISGSSSTFTIEAKFMSDGGNGAYPRLIGWDGFRIILAENSSGILSTYDGTWRVSSSASIRDGNWHHAALVIDNMQQRLYLDGNEVMVVNYGSNKVVNFNNSTMWIGSVYGGGGTERWNGNIDEVRVWDYARSERQIKDNRFLEMVGNEPGLVSYFDFEQTTKMDSVITNVAGGMHGRREGLTGNNTFGPKFYNDCAVDITEIICAGESYTSPSGVTLNTLGNYTDTVDVAEYFEAYNIELNDNNCVNIGVEELNDLETKIYPNPANGEVFVKINNHFEVANVKVISMLGTTIISEKINSEISRLDLVDFDKGVYFLEIEADGNITTKRLIKQ